MRSACGTQGEETVFSVEPVQKDGERQAEHIAGGELAETDRQGVGEEGGPQKALRGNYRNFKAHNQGVEEHGRQRGEHRNSLDTDVAHGARCACGLLSRGRLASPPDPARAIRHTLYTLWRTLIDVHARRAEFPDPDGFARAKERALSLLARLSRSL